MHTEYTFFHDQTFKMKNCRLANKSGFGQIWYILAGKIKAKNFTVLVLINLNNVI